VTTFWRGIGSIVKERTIMNSKFSLKGLLMGALLGAVIVLSVGAVENRRTSWEYKTAYNLSNEELNKLGDAEWELTGFCFSPRSPDQANDYFRYVFKRAK
jgi:hypothetical protein